MRILPVLYVLIFAVAIASSGPPVKYSQIRVFVPNTEVLDKIWASGIDFEGSGGKLGGWMEFVAGTHELEELAARQVPYVVVIDDAARRASEEIAPGPVDALGFGLGSMGGYYTFAEAIAQLDSMKLAHPALITAKSVIGYTNEGREIWGVKISDNPDDDEEEPSALYTALHHAREPGGMMTVLYYMWWLLDHYGTDPRATYVVDNRQLWFIPVVNPDGYVYNQTTNPTGGGFWRKNRRTNGDGTYGIDLNRNYGTFSMWNAPNGGSSTSPASDTYRGTSPFSEPETQAIDVFMRSHVIATCLNFHTYGRYLIYPWGYLSGESEDSLAYREFGFDMVATNRHTTGTDLQTVNYSTRGNSDDYMYGDDTKPKTFAMTPEAGSSFWPASSLILPIAQENLDMNLYAAYAAGQYTMLKGFTVSDAEPDGDIEPGESFMLDAVVRNKGLGDAFAVTVTVTSSDPAIGFSPSSAPIASLAQRGETTVSFFGAVAPSATAGSAVQVYVEIADTSGYAHRDTVTLYIGEQSILFADDAEGGTSHWSTGSGWGTSAVAFEGAASFTDSPSGTYPFNADNALAMLAPVDLAGCTHAVVRFATKWSIEPTWDFALVEISADGGGTWGSLRTGLSHAGSARGTQESGSWGYDGYTPGLDWMPQEIDLTPYVGGQVLLRFRLTSDGGDNRDGIYVDDIRLVGYRPLELRTSLFIADNGSGIGTLVLGESPTGTDGIDTLLGEAELPGAPAPGAFDARWQIGATNGATSDVRENLGPGHPSNTFTASLQAGPGGYPLQLRWSGEHLPPGGWRLRDQSGAGALFNVNMLLDTALTIADTSVHAVEIVHAGTDSMSFVLNDGWNMVSIPMDVPDASVAALFPTASSSAWSFWGTGYLPSDPLERGRGYWLKSAGGDTIRISGVPAVRDTILVPAGWAIVPASAVICPQSPAALACPGCPPYFIYDGGYALASLGLPGKGAFVKGPATIIHTCFGAAGAEAKTAAQPDLLAGLASLEIGDAAGGRTMLYFGAEGALAAPPDSYELPPEPPAGLFDARFASQRLAEAIPASEEGALVSVRASRYPVSIAWTLPAAAEEAYALEPLVGGEPTGTQTLRSSGRMTIADARVISLRLRRLRTAAAPAAFRLQPNYPNPFNPSTTISYEIAERALVTVKVVTTLGETVGMVVDHAELPPGRYSAVFDASSLSSGVYFTTMSAVPLQGSGSVQFSQKMLLIK